MRRSAARRGRPEWRATARAVGLGAVLLFLAGCGDERTAPSPLPGMPDSTDGPTASAAPTARADLAALVSRGAYLATVGNCAGCHTAPGGAPLAGGRRLETPYGAVVAGNLTPDPATGLGRWSADDFHRAMHEGRGRDGRRLIPAFPYTAFTRIARADNDALFAYLRSLAPVVQAPKPHELRFPYGTQAAMAVWQWLNFDPARAPATAPGEGLARGEYLVRGLGHCGECHAQRNRWSAARDELTGAEMPGERWYAPSLHPQAPSQADPTQTHSAVQVAQTVQLLRDGMNAHGSAAGPMAHVVRDSTQHWSPDDLELAARYLASLPPQPVPAAAPPADPALMAAGARLYEDRCADCHGRDGAGAPGAYPPLAGNPTVIQPDIRTLVQVMRLGGFAPSTARNPRPYGMPPAELSDAEIAAVLSHLRQSWGHRASAVSALDVMKAR